jgi:hypothetical protein
MEQYIERGALVVGDGDGGAFVYEEKKLTGEDSRYFLSS